LPELKMSTASATALAQKNEGSCMYSRSGLRAV
jgi:hypothetical protein